jgi:hypothetical protein
MKLNEQCGDLDECGVPQVKELKQERYLPTMQEERKILGYANEVTPVRR